MFSGTGTAHGMNLTGVNDAGTRRIARIPLFSTAILSRDASRGGLSLANRAQTQSKRRLAGP